MDGIQGNCELTKITIKDAFICAFVFGGEDPPLS